MSDIMDRISGIYEDLINLEVNTIIKPNIVGRKMGGPRHALLDIARKYNSKIVSLGFSLDLPEGTYLGSYESFEKLRVLSKEKLKNFAKLHAMGILTESDQFILMRIRNMSDQIKGIFLVAQNRGDEYWENNFTRADLVQSNPPFMIEPNELVIIRKAWELGIEEIAMQTIIQLDGDVLTRIQPEYAQEAHAALHKIHNEGIGTSVRFWKELVGIVKDLASAVVSKGGNKGTTK